MSNITKDREQLILDNEKLAYTVLWSYYPKFKGVIELDDAKGYCLLGLVKAAELYDETKGIEFSTFAYTCIRNELLYEIRKLNKIPKDLLVSLETPTTDNNVLSELIASPTDMEQDVEDSYLYKSLIECVHELSERDKALIYLKLMGKNQTEIGEILHLTQPNISRNYVKILNILRAKFERRGLL